MVHPNSMCLVLTISLVLIACAMTFLSLVFLFHRGHAARDLLAKIWNTRRQQVLHLHCLNGFDFLRDRLHSWSLFPLLASLITAAPLISNPDISLPMLGSIIVSGFTIRYGARFYVTTSKARHATQPLDYDGFGSYARAAADWREESRSVRSKALMAGVLTGCYALMWLTEKS